MSEGSRIANFILAMLNIALGYAYLSFGYQYQWVGYVWIGIGVGWLIIAIFYDTDMFRELDEDVRKRMVVSDVASFILGMILGYFIYGIQGAAYGMVIGLLSTESIGVVYFLYCLFFTEE